MRLFLALALMTAAPATADITASFIESAPKDRFVIENASDCTQTGLVVQIDLSTSAAGLIFDTTAAGAGVEVFQPFELINGKDLVAEPPRVTDGQTRVDLNIPTFPAGAKIVFTVDVDDTLPASNLGQIRVANSEIKGATLTVGDASAAFSDTAQAILARDTCNA